MLLVEIPLLVRNGIASGNCAASGSPIVSRNRISCGKMEFPAQKFFMQNRQKIKSKMYNMHRSLWENFQRLLFCFVEFVERTTLFLASLALVFGVGICYSMGGRFLR